MKVNLEDAIASMEEDRVHILNSISGMPLEQNPPAVGHAKYQEVVKITAWQHSVSIGNQLMEIENLFFYPVCIFCC